MVFLGLWDYRGMLGRQYGVSFVLAGTNYIASTVEPPVSDHP